MNVFVMNFLFLLLLIRLIPGAIIFYIFFQDSLQSPVAFYQVVSSLFQDYDIEYLKKTFPYFGDFLFLRASTCLLDGPGKGMVLFDVAEVKTFYFGLHGHPCTKVNHVCFG